MKLLRAICFGIPFVLLLMLGGGMAVAIVIADEMNECLAQLALALKRRIR
jgi:hypothetical protein